MVRLITASAVLALCLSAAHGEVSLTIYSSADPAGFDPQQFIAQQRQGHDPNFAWQVPGFGVVRDERELEFQEGRNTLSFTDVAAFMDPTTVSFADLTDADASTVLEQQFKFDLVSPDKILDRYIDRDVTVRLEVGDGVEEVTGKLLSNNQGQLVLQTADGLRLFSRAQGQIKLGELPGGLITKPTLQWLVDSKAAGKRSVRTTYQTSGLTWKADYNLVLNGDDTAADLAAWVTLINLSGIGYPDAKLKLIAGDVQKIQPQMMRGGRMLDAKMAATAEAGFEEKSFYEYHLYTLPRRTDIAQNTTQQLALFPTVSGAKVEKVLVYDATSFARHWGYGSPMAERAFGVESDKKVDVFIRFKNKQDNKLGVPLPRGKVRVFKQDDADKSLEFIGEDLIDHTAKNETVLIRTGQAFDVTGQRTQTNFTSDVRGKVMTESFKIELANAKDKPQKVVIVERLYRWSNWQLTEKSQDYKKIDARTIHFEVEVPAEGKMTVEYTVKYTW